MTSLKYEFALVDTDTNMIVTKTHDPATLLLLVQRSPSRWKITRRTVTTSSWEDFAVVS